jgi:adenylyltransferase/sulfurtransferase
MAVTALVGNVLSDVGLGWFRWADVVVGALDNREARVFVNAASARVGRPWIDGGIGVLDGIVRGFAPPATACYECTMSRTDWEALSERKSCSLLARQAMEHGGTSTTPITASVIGAIQVQEVVKLLHGMESLQGRGYVYQGATHDSYGVDYPIKPDCVWHEQQPPIEAAPDLSSESTMEMIWTRAAKHLEGIVAIDLSREIVDTATCPQCGTECRILRPAEAVTEDQIRCDRCGTERVPAFCHSITATSGLLQRTAAGIGLPQWDIVWARNSERSAGLELVGDRPDGKEARVVSDNPGGTAT